MAELGDLHGDLGPYPLGERPPVHERRRHKPATLSPTRRVTPRARRAPGARRSGLVQLVREWARVDRDAPPDRPARRRARVRRRVALRRRAPRLVPFWLPLVLLLAAEVEFVLRGRREPPRPTACGRVPPGPEDADLGFGELVEDDDGLRYVPPPAREPIGRRRASAGSIGLAVAAILFVARGAQRPRRDLGSRCRWTNVRVPSRASRPRRRSSPVVRDAALRRRATRSRVRAATRSASPFRAPGSPTSTQAFAGRSTT